MPQTFFPITPVRVTILGANYNWANVDITAHIPVANATLAVLYIDNGGTGAARDWGVKGHGPPTGWIRTLGGLSCSWAMVGIDPVFNPNPGYGFSFYNAALSDQIQAWLIGYATTGVVSNIASTNLSAAIGDDAWTMVDLGPAGLNVIPVGTLGVIVAARGIHPTDRDWGLRMNGSTDDRSWQSQHMFVVGVDASLRVECYRDNGSTYHYLIGYITDGVTFHQNAIEVTPAGLNTWNPLLPPLPASGIMGFIEVTSFAGGKYGAGDIGTLPFSRYLKSSLHNGAFVPASNWNGQKEDAVTQFFLTGYAHLTAPIVQTNPATGVT